MKFAMKIFEAGAPQDWTRVPENGTPPIMGASQIFLAHFSIVILISHVIARRNLRLRVGVGLRLGVGVGESLKNLRCARQPCNHEQPLADDAERR
jgi:hypothetical protein